MVLHHKSRWEGYTVGLRGRSGRHSSIYCRLCTLQSSSSVCILRTSAKHCKWPGTDFAFFPILFFGHLYVQVFSKTHLFRMGKSVSFRFCLLYMLGSREITILIISREHWSLPSWERGHDDFFQVLLGTGVFHFLYIFKFIFVLWQNLKIS